MPIIGCADSTLPTPPTLFTAANGCRRPLHQGRAVSVCYDSHQPGEWSEHIRQQERLSVFLNKAGGRLRWKPPRDEWRELPILGPTAWLIPSGTPHVLVCSEAAEVVTLFIEREFAAAVCGAAAPDVIVRALAHLVGLDALIGQLTDRFRHLCRNESAVNTLYVESIGTVLGAHLLQALLSSEAQPKLRGGLPSEALQRVASHIDGHLGDRLDLAILSRTAGFSSSHFGRLFKASLNFTPHEYVMRRRVAKAEELLRDTATKEVDIASLCGFSDETLMARWFRRVLGCCPRDIRARPRQ